MAGYSALVGLGLVVSSPWWLVRMATTGRYREGLRERLGAVPARLRAAVAGRHVVWVHAVSVGEVLAISRLVAELGTALNEAGDGPANETGNEAWTVVVSTTTRTGQALARERFGAERVFFFPLDLRWAVRAYLRVLRPAMLVLAESELWPRMLHECGRAGVPVAVVNARVSDRSFRRAWRFRALWRRVVRRPALWLTQSEEDAGRVTSLGARAASVHVSGNLKFDVRTPKRNSLTERLLEIAAGRPILVAGSTVGGRSEKDRSEDEMILHAWAGAPRKRFGALLVLAPRQPERFEAVFAMAKAFFVVRATDLLSGTKGDGAAQAVGCVVLNTIGDLPAVYSVADVAIVGGSLVARGGHNPLEPAQHGVPVVMGASFENFRDVVRRLQSAEGIRIVSTEGELADTLLRFLQAPEEARSMGKRGQGIFEREGGATARTVTALLQLAGGRATAPQDAVPA